jgi:site-specific recombinase XerD
MIIHSRQPKEASQKSMQLGILHDSTLCPVRTLLVFAQKSVQHRQHLPEDHTLFLSYLGIDEKPSRQSTVANLIQTEMKKVGIDTRFKAHSIRSAASTKAVHRGSSIQAVKQHANWSLTSNTFERYHYKPTAQASTSASTINSIFLENGKTYHVHGT